MNNSRGVSSKLQGKVTDLHSIYQESNRLTNDVSIKSLRTALKHLNSPLASSSRDKVLVLNQSSTTKIEIKETNDPKSHSRLPNISSRIDTNSPIEDYKSENKNFAFQTKSIKVLGDIPIDPSTKKGSEPLLRDRNPDFGS